ncbi:MAG TPA: hypothetical protein VFD30_10765 [Terriglobia bacterium]|jgi:hypothetical protein|nr:hypothetical protein [Terriglobia bacterium]
MPKITQIGNELAEIPFGELLRSVAQGIADGQRALDLTSIQTLITLSQTLVDIIPEVTEVITPSPSTVNISGQPPIQVTGARVQASAAAPVKMSALQAGITPTFYQFTEATIELKVSMQLRQVEETDDQGKKNSFIRAFSSHVNFRSQNTFTFNADAASSVTAILRPVPPPTRVVPSVITVNALGTTPTVTISP